jgi:hypothetical protein
MSLLDRLFARAPEPVPLTLYSKPGCHLCEVLKDELSRVDLGRPVALTVVDISGDAKLVELYGRRIPVLAAAGKPIAEGRVDVRALQRAFEARALEWDRARELARALERRGERG